MCVCERRIEQKKLLLTISVGALVAVGMSDFPSASNTRGTGLALNK